MEKEIGKEFRRISKRCKDSFNKASANIFYCSLNERYDERCKAAEVLGNLVYPRCCAKNCPKLKIEHNQENNH